MSGTIIETDAEIADSGEIITPVMQALGWYDLGDTQAKSLRNLANPAAPPVLAAASALPVSAGYATLSGAGGEMINTGIADPDDVTVFAVSRTLVGTDPWRALSCYTGNSGGSGRSMRLQDASGILSAVTQRAGGIGHVDVTVGDRTVWALTVARWSKTTGTVLIRDMTRGLSATNTFADQVKGTVPWVLGGNPTSAGGTVAGDLALAAIYGAALTDAQINEVAAFIRSEMAIKMPGVTI